MNIVNSQKKIISISKKIIKEKNYTACALNYFAVFEDVPGSSYLKFKLNKKKYFIKFIWNYFKYLMAVPLSKVEFTNNLDQKTEFKNLLISWGFKNNFDKNGNYTDKYIKKNSSSLKETLCLLVYMDKELPKKIKKNIVLVYRKRNFFKINFFFLITYVYNVLKNNLFKKNFLLYLTSFSALSFQIEEYISQRINLKKLKKLFLVYEGQPFQKAIIKKVRLAKKDIDILAYDHSAPPPLPLNLIYDNFSPDKLLVTGKAQINFYSKYMFWPKSKLKLIPTLRFKNETKNFYMNKFFIPFELNETSLALSSIEQLVEEKEIKNIKYYKIQNHPLRNQSSRHIKFIEDIKKIINQEKIKKFKSKNPSSIFFGQTTAIILALEFGIKCYHVCSNPIFDSYSSELWPELIVKKMNTNLFKYEVRKKNSFVRFHRNRKMERQLWN